MGLKDKISILDRNNLGNTGPTVGTTLPADGGYYTNEGQSDSPFESKNASGDHLADLLEDNIVKSSNSSLTYDPNQMIGLQPGPPAGDQDFDGVDGGQGYFHGIDNPGKGQGKQLGGKDLHETMLTDPYTNNGVTVGPSPGPSGHSEYQDLDGVDNGNGIFTIGHLEGKQLGGKDLHEGLLKKHYTYDHGGFSTTILQNKSGIDGGEFDLDGVDNGNGYFHGIPNPGREQGKQLAGVDLHEALLTKAYTYNQAGLNTTVGPSPGPSGHSKFQDMNGSTTDFGSGFTNPETGNYDGKYSYGLGPTDGYY